MDTVFVVISMIIVFALQLLVCFKSKSRTARLMPAALFLLASNAWLINPFDPRGYDTLGFVPTSLFMLFCAIACGLAWVVYQIVRLIVRHISKKNKCEDVAPDSVVEHTDQSEKNTRRKKLLTIVQILYIVLVFLFFFVPGNYFYINYNSLGDLILFLYVSVSVVINSIALVFVVKNSVIGIKQLIRAKEFFRLAITVVLIISATLSLWNVGAIFAANEESSYAVDITDENRENIASLIEDANKKIYNYNDLPGLDKATKIRHIINFLDDEFEISFEYGTTYRFSVDGTIYPLGQYIHDEGYNVYLRSPDYTRDRIILASSLSVTIISAAVLAVSIKKKHGIAESANSPAST